MECLNCAAVEVSIQVPTGTRHIDQTQKAHIRLLRLLLNLPQPLDHLERGHHYIRPPQIHLQRHL